MRLKYYNFNCRPQFWTPCCISNLISICFFQRFASLTMATWAAPTRVSLWKTARNAPNKCVTPRTAERALRVKRDVCGRAISGIEKVGVTKLLICEKGLMRREDDKIDYACRPWIYPKLSHWFVQVWFDTLVVVLNLRTRLSIRIWFCWFHFNYDYCLPLYIALSN